MQFRKKNLLIVLLCTSFLMGSCGKKKPIPEGTLRIAIPYDKVFLDPRKMGEPVSCLIGFMLFEGLTHLEADGTITLAAAESVQISKDRKTYLFTLRDSYWSNGMRVTAHDFEYSWKSILSPHFPAHNAFLFFIIKNAKKAKQDLCSVDQVGIKAISERELLVELEEVAPYFLELIAFCSFFPVPSMEELRNPDWISRVKEGIPSNGPFTLDQWNIDRELIVKKNPYYRDAHQVHLNKIELLVVENELTRIHLFDQKKIDWIGSLSSALSPDLIAPYRRSNLLFSGNFSGVQLLTFNLNSPPLNNLNIRKALSSAIDRKAIVENITCKQAATSLIPPDLRKGFSTLSFSDGNKKEALFYFNKGLEELQTTADKLPPIYLEYPINEIDKRVAQAIQNQWLETFGIHVELVSVDLKILIDDLYKKQYSIAQIPIIAQYNDPMNILERFLHLGEPKNYSGWSNPLFTDLIGKGNRAKNYQKRAAAFSSAERLLIDEMPITPLYFMEQQVLQHLYVQGVELSPIGVFDFRHAWVENPSEN